MKILLDEILAKIENLDWRLQVYVRRSNRVELTSECILIDVDDAELGSDGFTPKEAEDAGMDEFLAVNDIAGVKNHLLRSGAETQNPALLRACVYYFENDAYPPV
jgi:hypothetical protein